MFNKILNKDYYKSIIKTFAENVEFNADLLPLNNFNKINLSFIQRAINNVSGFNLFISIPRVYKTLIEELYSNIYLFIANQQFYENYSNPTLNLKQKLIEKNGKRIYEIISHREGLYNLKEIIKENPRKLRYPAFLLNRSYQVILNNFLIIKKKMKKKTIDSFITLFCKLNNLNNKSDMIPTDFSSVSVFIGSKNLWESFKKVIISQNNLWKCLPSQYISREGHRIETMGFAPLIYFTPSYIIAYQEILQKQIKVSNIILFDDGFDELQQIINDQDQYDFKILGISTKQIENRLPQIKYWKWRKEEIHLIESL